jgi:hypothetical protein
MEQRLKLGRSANHLLEQHQVKDLQIDARTGDIRVIFHPELALDVFNNSSFLEGWQIQLRGPGETVTIIGSASYASPINQPSNDA